MLLLSDDGLNLVGECKTVCVKLSTASWSAQRQTTPVKYGHVPSQTLALQLSKQALEIVSDLRRILIVSGFQLACFRLMRCCSAAGSLIHFNFQQKIRLGS